jgi:hypothetical protein
MKNTKWRRRMRSVGRNDRHWNVVVFMMMVLREGEDPMISEGEERK